MNVQKLKSKLQDYKRKLAECGNGAVIISSDHGPVGIGIIEDIVEAIDDLDDRITTLERDNRR